MVPLESVLLRLGDRIGDLIGSEEYKLLHALGNNLSNQDALVRLAVDIHTPWGLLRNKNHLAIIINSLVLDEATELALRLGIGYERTPYKALRDHTFRKNSKKEELLLGFFGVTIPDGEDVVELGETVQIIPAMHGLFPHQKVALGKIEHILEHEGGRAVLHMPTGSGKTRTAMNLATKHLNQNGKTVVLWLAHSEELCEQAAEEFEQAWSHQGDRNVPLRKFYSGHDWEDTDDGIIIAGLSKLWRYVDRTVTGLHQTAPKISLIIFDEAHQTIAKTFQLPVEIITTRNPSCKLLGLTATPGRTWDDLFEDLKLSEFYNRKKVSLEVEGYPSAIDYLVDEGYLSRPEFKQLEYTKGPLLTKDELTSALGDSDFSTKLLKSLSEDGLRNAEIILKVRELVLSGHNRILVFAINVRHAITLSSILNFNGFESDVITSQTDSMVRKRAITRFKEEGGGHRILCNYGVLTTGFDAPKTSAAVIARPTQSLVLYSQMVGRVIRGPRVKGTEKAEIWTVVDTNIPGFGGLVEGFTNWEDVW
jgi:superfamily II DNA or RNA helicase